jgi:beta-xylosidase
MYKNPILAVDRRAGADPAVFYHEDAFYFYSTNPDNAVFISSNLTEWTKGPTVLPPELKGAWAPEVFFHREDRRFYIYYTRKYKIGVAVADRPDALFSDLGILIMDGIDAHPFRDDDGRLYLYFTHTPGFSIHCVPMKSPTETGGPITRCLDVSQPWETNSFAINEGPWMLKRNGMYTLLYSGSDGRSRYYAVGAASAPTPISPFTKYPDNPVFQDLEHVSGAGHGSVTFDRAGNLWHLYHQKVDARTNWIREIGLDPVRVDANGRWGGTPTRGVEQPAPVMDSDLVWIPEILPRGAVFNGSVTVPISSRTDPAIIRYTLDGSEPGPNSPRYTDPLVLTESAVVKAMAFRDGMRDSAVAAEAFRRTDLPLVANPSPDAAPGDPGFKVFPRPAARPGALR